MNGPVGIVLSELQVTVFPSTGRKRVSYEYRCCMIGKNGKVVTMTFSESDLIVLSGAWSVQLLNRRQRRRFFLRDFFMDSLTNELLGIKQSNFEVGDLVKTRAATDAYGMAWLGIITKVTMLKNADGDRRNLYTVDWVAGGEAQVLWYDWYDEDLDLVQPGADC